MSKIIRLTESDLIRLVNRVINEQSEMGKDPFRREGGGDFDYFGKIIVPQMKQAGFKMVDDSKIMGQQKCPYYCCKYFCYPDHSNGVNLALQCGNDPTKGAWKLIVFYKGNKGLKNFEPSKMGAKQAVEYAIQLKNKMYPSKGSMQEQSSKPKYDCTLLKEIPRQGRKDLKGAFAQGFKPNHSDWQERIKILGNMPKVYQIDTHSSVALGTVSRCKPSKSKVEVVEFQKGNEYITYIGTD